MSAFIEEYKLKPYSHLTEEERSLIILGAYRVGALKREDVKSYITSIRFSNFSAFFFPFVAYPLLSKFVFRGIFARRFVYMATS